MGATMVLGSLRKQPGETRRITVDWEDRFLSSDDNEQVTSVSISDGDLTVSAINSPPYGVGYFLVSGGTSGEEYTVTFTATTSLGQIIESEIIVVVEEVE